MKLKIIFFIISGLYFLSVVGGLIFSAMTVSVVIVQSSLCILFLILALARKANKQCNSCHVIIHSTDTFCGNCGVKI
jgi:hypothetical protein